MVKRMVVLKGTECLWQFSGRVQELYDEMARSCQV